MQITIKVLTNARQNEIIKLSDTEYKIKVTVIPEKGKANAQIIKMLSKYLKKPKSSIKIIKGITSSNKIIEIQN